jgi:hypothetical protein
MKILQEKNDYLLSETQSKPTGYNTKHFTYNSLKMCNLGYFLHDY